MAQIVLLHENAIVPRKATDGSEGYDLFSTELESIKITGYDTEIIGTGIGIKPKPGFYARVADRSSLAKSSLVVTGGVIDPDYTGEIRVTLDI